MPCRDAIEVIEADGTWPRREFAGEITARRPTDAEVPLPDACGAVTNAFQERGSGELLWMDHQRCGISGRAELLRCAPAIAAREQGIASGRANGGWCAGIGETHPFSRDAVTVRCLQRLWIGPTATKVGTTHIIRKDENDVRRLRSAERCAEGEE